MRNENPWAKFDAESTWLKNGIIAHLQAQKNSSTSLYTVRKLEYGV